MKCGSPKGSSKRWKVWGQGLVVGSSVMDKCTICSDPTAIGNGVKTQSSRKVCSRPYLHYFSKKANPLKFIDCTWRCPGVQCYGVSVSKFAPVAPPFELPDSKRNDTCRNSGCQMYSPRDLNRWIPWGEEKTINKNYLYIQILSAHFILYFHHFIVNKNRSALWTKDTEVPGLNSMCIWD